MDNFNLIVGKSNTTSNVVQVNNFSVTVGSKKLFDDSELVLSPGNIYGLIGKNGCGKTTLLKMITSGNIPVNERILVLCVEQEIEDTEKSPVQLLLESNGSFYKHQVRIKELEDIMGSEDFGEREDSDELLEAAKGGDEARHEDVDEGDHQGEAHLHPLLQDAVVEEEE